MNNDNAQNSPDHRPAVGVPVERMVRPRAPNVERLKMRQTSEDNYTSDSGHRMQREYGLTPLGNHIGGRWVLRGPDAEWIDVDRYRYDLLERHGFVVA